MAAGGRSESIAMNPLNMDREQSDRGLKAGHRYSDRKVRRTGHVKSSYSGLDKVRQSNRLLTFVDEDVEVKFQGHRLNTFRK
eukprot:1349452-Amorphochlora_amoeboformis.AAC.2